MRASGRAAGSGGELWEQFMDGNKSRTPLRHPARVARWSPTRHGAPKPAMRTDCGGIAGVARCVVRGGAGAEARRAGSSGAPNLWRYGQETRQYQLKRDCVRTQDSDRSTPPGRREAQARNWHSASPVPPISSKRAKLVEPRRRHVIPRHFPDSKRSIRPRAHSKSQTEIINPSYAIWYAASPACASISGFICVKTTRLALISGKC